MFEFPDPFHSASPEGRCIAGDRRFAEAVHLGNPAVECLNEFEQFTDGWCVRQRHRGPLYRSARDRAAFHTSPQLVHRQ